MESSVFVAYSFDQIIRYGIALIFFFSMLLAIGYTVWGGFLMVVSGGNEEKVKAAVNHIRYAVLGIIVLVIILFVAPNFLSLIGLGAYSQYFQPTQILATIQEITANIFGGSAGSNYYDSNLDTISPSSSDFSSL